MWADWRHPLIHYGERNAEVCPGEEQAGNEAGMHTRDQRREGAHEGDAAAAGGTPCAGGCHVRVVPCLFVSVSSRLACPRPCLRVGH